MVCAVQDIMSLLIVRDKIYQPTVVLVLDTCMCEHSAIRLLTCARRGHTHITQFSVFSFRSR